MAHVIWPPSLDGVVEKQSYNEIAADNLMSTNFDIGPPQIVRRSTGAPVQVSMSILVNLTQLATFKAFYRTSLVSGSHQFEWVKPIEQTPVIMQFKAGDQPAISPAGGTLYRVALSLNMFEEIPV